ncbi:MAG TPA: hypothetical protein VFK56_06095 [Mycobacterium sp.]|nr:hypothetical protein [Mycobacterium sp.]
MTNAKHIGYMGALAVALGVGLAVANTPAVASAAPGDSGKGSSSGESSQSSHPPSAKKGGSTTTNHAPGHRRREGAANTATATTTGKSRNEARKPLNLRQRSDSVLAKVHPKPAVITANVARPTSGESHANLSMRKAALTPPPAATDAPAAPVPNPAALMLLAFTRREFQPSTTVNHVADTAVSTSAADPDFISSTHNLGPISITSAADPDDDHYVAFVLATPFFTNVLTSGTDPEDNLGFGAASIGVAGHTVNTFMSPRRNFTIAIPITDPLAPVFTVLVRLGF